MSWINANGQEMTPEVWDDPRTMCFGMLLDGRAQATGIRRASGDETLLWILNAFHDMVEFTLPEVTGGDTWARLLDTNAPDAADEQFRTGDAYGVTGRSCVIFVLRTTKAAAAPRPAPALAPASAAGSAQAKAKPAAA